MFTMKKKLLSAFLVLLFCSAYSQSARSEVWVSNQKWDKNWEKEYAGWVRNQVPVNVFTNGKTILSGLRTDCADALYAIRILFSYENSLPFLMSAPNVLKSKMETFGSDTDMFDSIKDEKQRVREFIKFIMAEAGTRELQKDTYPIKISSITSGTLYLVEWRLFGRGKFNQHSYLIKGLNNDRELVYYYSDMPIKVRDFKINVKYPRFAFSYAPYGYRAWKHPEHLLIPENQIPEALGYSQEQYELVRRVGSKNILAEIRKRIRQ